MKTYSEYKDSGIDWIGKIPKSWSTNKIKYVSNVNSEALTEKTSGELEIHYIDIGNCNADGTYNPPEPIKFSEAPSRARRVVHTNDTIISTVRTYLKAIAFIKESTNNLIASTGFAVLNPVDVNPRFLFYSVKAQHFVDTVCSLSVGVSYPAINASVLSDIKICFPDDPKEQEKIVLFLDGKVKKINDSIKKKRRLIQLLKEQRIAVINRAVTKGLNKNVELKDSGIEWIGKIPMHWDFMRLKYVSKLLFSNVDKKVIEDEIKVQSCNYVDVYKNEFIDQSIPFLDISAKETEIEKFSIKRGDVLVTKDSETAQDIAVPAYVVKEIENLLCGYHLAIIRGGKGLLGEYVFRVFQSRDFNIHFEISAKGVTRFGLSMEAFKDSMIPVPPIPEQKEIVKFLNEETLQIDESIVKIQKEIELLQEYKEALISEAVTGKIKVAEVLS